MNTALVQAMLHQRRAAPPEPRATPEPPTQRRLAASVTDAMRRERALHDHA